VRDGCSSYQWDEQCRHSLWHVHRLRGPVFVAEVHPEHQVWTTPLAKLRLKSKDAAAQAKAVAGVSLSEQMTNEFLRRDAQLR
jgi:hypothetical protein